MRDVLHEGRVRLHGVKIVNALWSSERLEDQLTALLCLAHPHGMTSSQLARALRTMKAVERDATLHRMYLNGKVLFECTRPAHTKRGGNITTFRLCDLPHGVALRRNAL